MNTPISVILKDKGYKVLTTTPDDTVYDCATKMSDAGIGALVVVIGESLKGIVSERDMMRKIICLNKDPSTTKVSEVMSEDPLTVTLDTTIQEAIRTVTEKRFRHLPVVDNGKLVGMISIGDLTRWIMLQQEKEIAQLTGYIHGVNH